MKRNQKKINQNYLVAGVLLALSLAIFLFFWFHSSKKASIVGPALHLNKQSSLVSPFVWPDQLPSQVDGQIYLDSRLDSQGDMVFDFCKADFCAGKEDNLVSSISFDYLGLDQLKSADLTKKVELTGGVSGFASESGGDKTFFKTRAGDFLFQNENNSPSLNDILTALSQKNGEDFMPIQDNTSNAKHFESSSWPIAFDTVPGWIATESFDSISVKTDSSLRSPITISLPNTGPDDLALNFDSTKEVKRTLLGREIFIDFSDNTVKLAASGLVFEIKSDLSALPFARNLILSSISYKQNDSNWLTIPSKVSSGQKFGSKLSLTKLDTENGNASYFSGETELSGQFFISDQTGLPCFNFDPMDYSSNRGLPRILDDVTAGYVSKLICFRNNDSTEKFGNFQAESADGILDGENLVIKIKDPVINDPGLQAVKQDGFVDSAELLSVSK
ncbi:MAG: hypothetical protein NTW50_04155 [Candidatus Berkelbacteria bacterium]|nr:hypothetical protein [Candidatus Berkelbacteria bacterium]